MDSALDMQFNRARYYDNPAGRWISQDPAGKTAGDPNLYRYVQNGPTTATDPTGLRLFTFRQVVGAFGSMSDPWGSGTGYLSVTLNSAYSSVCIWSSPYGLNGTCNTVTQDAGGLGDAGGTLGCYVTNEIPGIHTYNINISEQLFNQFTYNGTVTGSFTSGDGKTYLYGHAFGLNWPKQPHSFGADASVKVTVTVPASGNAFLMQWTPIIACTSGSGYGLAIGSIDIVSPTANLDGLVPIIVGPTPTATLVSSGSTSTSGLA